MPEVPDHATLSSMSVEQVLDALETRRAGLRSEEVAQRHTSFGPNVLLEKQGKTLITMIVDQFLDPMVGLLVAAAVISGAIGEVHDAVVIFVILILNSIIGLVQDYRAEKAVQALKEMASPEAKVIRAGKTKSVPSAQLVPGDIVLLEAGDIVPADTRLLEAHDLKVDESPLTGESIPVKKEHVPVPGATTVHDMKNLAFKGTNVTSGRGVGVIAHTGMSTEMGRIASLIQEAKDVKTPLQKKLARVGKNLALAAIVISALVFFVGLFQGKDAMTMLLTSMSLAVAAVPEALPAVVTICLALGARNMVKRNCLIRRLTAVEALGSVTTVCTDKTGTLTLNKMKIEEVTLLDGTFFSTPNQLSSVPKGSAQWQLLLSMAVSNDVSVDEKNRQDMGFRGDPTEVALVEFAHEAGFSKEDIEKIYPRVGEIPFDAQRKAMTTVHKSVKDGTYFSITKGALEALIEMSKISPTQKKELIEAQSAMAGKGLRVLAFGIKWLQGPPRELKPDLLEKNIQIIGIAGAMDPPRPEAKKAIETAQKAGIRPVMITGDHPVTAINIGKRIGLLKEGDEGHVVTGSDIEENFDLIRQKILDVRIFARTVPEQKLKIIKAFQEKGQAVAMTGDGVNDAPALKQAEIGVAMGVTGTQVAKGASDMILLDDNFATIVGAVEEGRKIYDNIRKFIKYTLTSNSGEIWTIFLAPFLGLPVPLLPIHILWVNLITDGLPGLAFSMEKAEADVMNRPPRPPTESLFAHGMWQHILSMGLLMGFICLGLQKWAFDSGAHWQTMVFTAMCFVQFGHALSIRSETDSFLNQGPFSNPFLISSILISVVIQLLIVYVPLLQGIFKTQALSIKELLVVFVCSTGVFWAVELEKMFRRRKRSKGFKKT